MIDKKQFADMKKEMVLFNDKREAVISQSRDIIALSKKIIYGLHRNEPDKKLITEITQKIKKLPKEDYNTGMGRVAQMEFVEAVTFYEFMVNKHIPSYKQMGVDSEVYLLGLCDLPGELVRKAVYLAGKDRYADVIEIRDLVEEIYGELLAFDFRDNEVRSKFDAVKYDLRKLEDLVLDLKLKHRIK